jgi:hypothetical protein
MNIIFQNKLNLDIISKINYHLIKKQNIDKRWNDLKLKFFFINNFKELSKNAYYIHELGYYIHDIAHRYHSIDDHNTANKIHQIGKYCHKIGENILLNIYEYHQKIQLHIIFQ